MERSEVKAWRRIFYWILMFGLMIPSVQWSSPAAHAAGKLIVNPMSFDCGVVEEGAPATMQVQIENVGDSEVLIQNVQTN